MLLSTPTITTAGTAATVTASGLTRSATTRKRLVSAEPAKPRIAPTIKPTNALTPVTMQASLTKPGLSNRDWTIAVGFGITNGCTSRITTQACQRPTKTSPKATGGGTSPAP